MMGIHQSGQTVTADGENTSNARGTPDTTFVFNSSFDLGVTDLFPVDGANHDLVSYSGSDFGMTRPTRS